MQSLPRGVYGPVALYRKTAQPRVELLQLLPSEHTSVRETESEIISVSEILLEQHEPITSLKFSISVFNTICLGKL